MTHRTMIPILPLWLYCTAPLLHRTILHRTIVHHIGALFKRTMLHRTIMHHIGAQL
jgi:hypothetical protein